jgi:hypothetical protein
LDNTNVLADVQSEDGFYLYTDNGVMLILPMKYATVIRDARGLSFPLFARNVV